MSAAIFNWVTRIVYALALPGVCIGAWKVCRPLWDTDPALALLTGAAFAEFAIVVGHRVVTNRWWFQ